MSLLKGSVLITKILSTRIFYNKHDYGTSAKINTFASGLFFAYPEMLYYGKANY